MRARGVARRRIVRGLEHRDDVEQRAVAKRVVNDVEARPRPQHHVVAVDVERHVCHRHHGAVRDVADHARLALVEHLLADGGAQAVRADQRRALDGLIVLGAQQHAAAARFERGDIAACDQFDVRQRPAGVEQHAVQVDAMDDDVGPLEPALEALAGRDADDLAAVSRVDHQHRLGADRLRQHRISHAEPVEHREDVGAELDAVADDAELLRLLEHAHGIALAAERERSRRASQSAADDQNRFVLARQTGPPRISGQANPLGV